MSKKKKIVIIAAAAAALLLTVISIVIICSVADEPSPSGKKDDPLILETLDGTEHLTQAPTVSFPDPEQTETPTVDMLTENETEDATDVATEEETTAPVVPAPSLKFLSNGNGTCSVTGIGDVTDVYVSIPERSPSGDVVIAIEDKAFYNDSHILAVSIPSTVMSIGNRAFGGCSSLVYISVNENNKAFCDIGGILYSKDRSRLVLFPASNPASEINIAISVTEIADMAFASAPNLKLITYSGSLRDWSNIKIGDENYGLFSAAMTFTGGK